MLLLILNCKLLVNYIEHVKKKNERRLRVRRNVYNVDNVENEREFLLTKRFPSLQNNHFKKIIILFVHRNKTKLLKKNKSVCIIHLQCLHLYPTKYYYCKQFKTEVIQLSTYSDRLQQHFTMARRNRHCHGPVTHMNVYACVVR